ncbi:MAG TPA: molybdopterin-dependent oxidoreductase, partial [Gemmataceae bacterium]
MSREWDLPDREITPEAALLTRRRWLKWAGLGGIAAAAGAGVWWWYRGGSDDEVVAAGRVETPGMDLYPATPHSRFRELDRALTGEPEAARYCNFYEFSVTKGVWRSVQTFRPVPWTLEVTGLVAKPRTFDLDDLLHAFPLEERNYRHRCVETWAM